MQIGEAITPESHARSLDKIVLIPPLCDQEVAERIDPSTYADVLCILHEYWKNVMFWVAYEMVPDIDIYRKPYNTPKFRYLRPMGNYCFRLQQLCKGCIDADVKLRDRARSSGLTPMGLWIKVMHELMQDHSNSVCTEDSNGPKGKIQSGANSLLSALQSNSPEQVEELFQHRTWITSLHQSAIALKSKRTWKQRDAFLDQYWKPLLSSVKQLKENAPTSTIGVWNNKSLMVFEGAHKRKYAAKIQDLDEDQILVSLSIPLIEGTSLIIDIPKKRFTDHHVYINN